MGIETSCDETAAALVEGERILSNVVFSQTQMHRRYRGVVPELASRAHQQKILPVICEALDRAFPGARLRDLPDLVDGVAFTQGPGLLGALLVGKTAAQTLAWLHGLPAIGVNHLEGHAFAIEFQERIAFPFIGLIVSGGHTDLVWVRGYGRFRVLGRTRDDAAGEAFDKVAKLLGLGFPGGPLIDRLARRGDPEAILFPRPVLPGTWDFSFSGLKTAVLYHLQKNPRSRPENVCAAFQEAIVDTLTRKTLDAAQRFGVSCVVVGGGVAANSRLRLVLTERGVQRGVRVRFPAAPLCTDNGAMIARVGLVRLREGRLPRSCPVDPALPMRSWIGSGRSKNKFR